MFFFDSALELVSFLLSFFPSQINFIIIVSRSCLDIHTIVSYDLAELFVFLDLEPSDLLLDVDDFFDLVDRLEFFRS